MMATGYKTIMFLTTDLSGNFILIVVLSVKRLFNKTFTVITEWKNNDHLIYGCILQST